MINIDDCLKPLTEPEATGLSVDACVRALAFNYFVDIDRHPTFIVALSTHNEQLWEKLLSSSDQQCWLLENGTGIALFEPSADCGATTIYHCTPSANQRRRFASPQPASCAWKFFQSEFQLLDFLYRSDRPAKYESWVSYQRKAQAVPIELAEGRFANTTVDKAMICSRGDGCVFCGAPAPAYAATTICDGKLLVQLPVCPTHLERAKAAPTVLSVLAELFHAEIHIPRLQKFDHIPDQYIPSIVSYLSRKLMSTVSLPEKRKNGWHTELTRPSGWSWVLRLQSLDDYAYVLLDPNRRQRHRIDSAPHHPDVPFGPSHKHSHPDKKNDHVSPSFTYGLPLFDVVSLNDIVSRHEQGTP